jgi:hypothetical protein
MLILLYDALGILPRCLPWRPAHNAAHRIVPHYIEAVIYCCPCRLNKLALGARLIKDIDFLSLHHLQFMALCLTWPGMLFPK